MYLTQINMIRGLTKAEYFQLRELCFFSNCLYNFALYNLRQKFFADKIYLRFEANYHECKDNDNYKLLQSNIREVKIIPLYKGRAFKIAYCYDVDEKNLKLNRENSMGIDIGLDNLATCVTNFGTSFLMDGRKIKHINRNWNKRRAYLQSILMKQGSYSSKLLERITLKRNNQINDCLKKTARYIINFCIANDIGTVICGYNSDFKRRINLGKKINQQFTQIPFGALRRQPENLCARYGMSYIEQEESYTSKASFLDLDELPIFDAEKPYTGSFSGKRIRRGLYRSSSGRLVNADVNGAANILRKGKQNLDFELLCVGLLDRPLRIRVA